MGLFTNNPRSIFTKTQTRDENKMDEEIEETQATQQTWEPPNLPCCRIVKYENNAGLIKSTEIVCQSWSQEEVSRLLKQAVESHSRIKLSNGKTEKQAPMSYTG